jgi:hypothetical protein
MLPFDRAMLTEQEAHFHVSGADREEGRLRKVYIIDSNPRSLADFSAADISGPRFGGGNTSIIVTGRYGAGPGIAGISGQQHCILPG